jgi:hypothetical protein
MDLFICPFVGCDKNKPARAMSHQAVTDHIAFGHPGVTGPVAVPVALGRVRAEVAADELFAEPDGNSEGRVLAAMWQCYRCPTMLRDEGGTDPAAWKREIEAHLATHVEKCGAWPDLGGCILEHGHNRSRLDIPENHQFLQDEPEPNPYELKPDGAINYEKGTIRVTYERETVNHPAHYGGDTTYEAIKVIEAWELGFCLGNTVKYISRAGRKHASPLEDLKKAAWYLQREIDRLESS